VGGGVTVERTRERRRSSATLCHEVPPEVGVAPMTGYRSLKVPMRRGLAASALPTIRPM